MMHLLRLCATALLFSVLASGLFAQVGIGTTTPNANAILDLETTDKGLLLPRLDRTAITTTATEAGMLVYDNVANELYIWNGSAWQPLATGGTTPWTDLGGGKIGYATGDVQIDNELLVGVTSVSDPFDKATFETNGTETSVTILNTAAGGDARLVLNSTNGTNDNYVRYVHSGGTWAAGVASSNTWAVAEGLTPGNSPRLQVYPGGNVKIGGGAVPTARLGVNGAIALQTGTSVNTVVDEATAISFTAATDLTDDQLLTGLAIGQVISDSLASAGDNLGNHEITQPLTTTLVSGDILSVGNAAFLRDDNLRNMPVFAAQTNNNIGQLGFGSPSSNPFITGNTSTLTISANTATRFVIENVTGNVGIGNSITPGAKLDVQGDFRLQTGTNVNNIIDETTAQGFTVATDLTDNQLLTGLAIGEIISDSLATAGDNLGNHTMTQPLTSSITDQNIVQIGDAAWLRDGLSPNQVVIEGIGSTDFGAIQFGSTASNPQIVGSSSYWRLFTGGAARIHVDAASGNIGIGTTSPVTNFEIAGNTFISSGTLGLPIGTDVNELRDDHTLTTDVTRALLTQSAINQLISDSLTAAGTAWQDDGTNAWLPSGNVGIGTTNPVTDLVVVGEGTTPTIANISYGGADGPTVFLGFAGGTEAAPTALGANSRIGGYGFGGWDGTDFQDGAQIAAENDVAWSGTNRGADLLFSTTANGTTALTERMRITANGNVAIGNIVGNARLDVSGDMRLNTGTSVDNIVDQGTATGFTTSTDLTDLQLLTGAAIAQIISDSLSASSTTLQGAYNGGNTITGANAVEVNTDNGLVVSGTHGTGVIPATGAGSRLMWYPGKSAFRAGQVSGATWDDASVGIGSFATGFNTTASADYTTSMGYNTDATANYSTALGNTTLASGGSSMATGYLSTASGDFSTAMGFRTTAAGDYSTAIGRGIEVQGENSLAIALNDQFGTTMTASNTMAILGGNLGVGETAPTALLHVNGDFRVGTGSAVSNIVDSLTLDGFTTADDIADTMLLTGSAIKTLISDSLSVASPWNTNIDGIDYTAANVGIGTNTPAYALHVEKNVPGDWLAYINNTSNQGNLGVENGLKVRVNDNRAGDRIFQLENEFGVITYVNGIGQFLHSGFLGVEVNTTGPAARIRQLGGTSTRSGLSVVVDGAHFNTYAIDATVAGNSLFRVATDGNTGIDVDDPTAKLDVGGDFRVAYGTTVSDIVDSTALSSFASFNELQDTMLLSANAIGALISDSLATAGGLTNFEETTVALSGSEAAVWRPEAGVGADAGIVLHPRGNGYLAANQPDNTSMGGDDRGNFSVDWQVIRTNATQVASSTYSTISGGWENTASNFSSTVGGGRANVASGSYATVPGGFGLEALSYGETVVGTFNDNAGYTPTAGSWAAADRAFVVGIGLDNVTRANALTVLKNGNVGIGTSFPTVPFELHAQNANLMATSYTASPVAGATLMLKKSRGAIGVDAAVQNNDVLANLMAMGVNVNNFETQAGQIQFQVDGAPTLSTVPGRIAFRPTNLTTGVPETRMIIKQDGNVGIGETSPAALLDVNGDIQLASGTNVNDIVDAATESGFTVPGDYTDDALLTAAAINQLVSANSSLWSTNANGIHYNTDNVGIGTTNPTFPLSVRGGGTDERAISVTHTYSGSATKEALHITTTTDGTGQKTGIYNDVAELNTQTARVTGMLNTIDATSSAEKRGVENRFNGTGGGDIYAIRNDLTAYTGTGNTWGTYNDGELFNFFSGSVGIGSENPQARLEIWDDNAADVSSYVENWDGSGTPPSNFAGARTGQFALAASAGTEDVYGAHAAAVGGAGAFSAVGLYAEASGDADISTGVEAISNANSSFSNIGGIFGAEGANTVDDLFGLEAYASDPNLSATGGLFSASGNAPSGSPRTFIGVDAVVSGTGVDATNIAVYASGGLGATAPVMALQAEDGHVNVANGNVGIGIGALMEPFAPLEVANTGTGASAQFIDGSATGANNFGLEIVMQPTNTANTDGVNITLEDDATNNQSLYGVSNTFDAVGDGQKAGVYNTFTNSGSSASTSYGLYNQFDPAYAGDRYGVFSSNDDFNYFTGEVGIGVDPNDGSQVKLAVTTPGASGIEVTSNGTGPKTGVFANMTSAGTNANKTGFSTTVVQGALPTASANGYESYIFGEGAGERVGFRADFSDNGVSGGTTSALRVRYDLGMAGNTYGVYSENEAYNFFSGRVGIGVGDAVTPLARLYTEVGEAEEITAIFRSLDPVSNAEHTIATQRANGGGAITSDYELGRYAMGGFNGDFWTTGGDGGAFIRAKATENWLPGAHGTELSFATTRNGTGAAFEQMFITQNGNVGINNDTPEEKLHIVGGTYMRGSQRVGTSRAPSGVGVYSPGDDAYVILMEQDGDAVQVPASGIVDGRVLIIKQLFGGGNTEFSDVNGNPIEGGGPPFTLSPGLGGRGSYTLVFEQTGAVGVGEWHIISGRD